MGIGPMDWGMMGLSNLALYALALLQFTVPESTHVEWNEGPPPFVGGLVALVIGLLLTSVIVAMAAVAITS